MMKALVSGAFGLVGQHIVKSLESRGYRVIKMHLDELLFPEDYGGYDVVAHAGGYGQPQMFSKDKLKTIEINTTLTKALFKFLKPNGKFLFISSSEVYSGAPTPYKETYIGTTTPQHPRACYIEGKRCGEAICMAMKEQGYDVKIARLALAYGPGTKKGDTRVLNQFIEQALTTGQIVLKDMGLAMRTYVYIEDAVEMMIQSLFLGKEVVYNIGGESTISIYHLAEMIGNIIGVPVLVTPDGFGLSGAPEDVKLCLNRYKSEFDIRFVSLDEGLKRTIEYQKQLYA